MKCERCDGDGYLDVMDPDHYGAVIGMRECPDCDGSGTRDDFWNEEPTDDDPA